MAVTRLRWGLGLALTLLALLAAVRALGAYVDHRLWLGSASVALLALIAVGGLASLGQARRRIERELAALGATPPAGELLAERRRRLEAVRAAGATADLDALAAATAADERGRAYLGRYLVAVTVLVGLVGTFAGLMDTLRGVAPLIRDDHVSTMQALALPLAGLDVTFGASVVGILVTLALSLVQGDLVLAEEQALARLEELTAHRLVPALWPPAERADERLLRAVTALHGELRVALSTAHEASAAQVAAVARAEVDRLVGATRELLAGASAAAVDAVRAAQAASVTATTALETLARDTASAFDQAARAATSALAHTSDEAARRVAAATENAAAALADGGARSLAAAEALGAHATARVDESYARSLRAAEEQAQAIEAQLRAAGATMTEVAGELRAGAASMSAAVATLGPELNAMAREVALLAARAEAGPDLTVGDELVRLGDGLERLEKLLERERSRRERA